MRGHLPLYTSETVSFRTTPPGTKCESPEASNNRLQWTGTLKVREASKVLFRSVVLRKEFRPTEPGVRVGKGKRW